MDSSSSRRLSLQYLIFWREGKAPGLGTQPMDWVITGLQGACGRLLLPTLAAFCPTNKMPFAELSIFWKYSSWRSCGCSGEFLMHLWGVSFSAGTGNCCVAIRSSQCNSWLEGICYGAVCAGPACRHLARGAGEMPYWDSSSALHLCWVMAAGTGLNSGTTGGKGREEADQRFLILVSTLDICLLRKDQFYPTIPKKSCNSSSCLMR